MTMTTSDRLTHYRQWSSSLEDPYVELDLSHAELSEAAVAALEPALARALVAMQALEGGAIANADEQRMVGHYWLRMPGLAPDEATQDEIKSTLERIEAFAADVHAGTIAPPSGGKFEHVVLCGIGGSALGPMLLGAVFAADGPMALTVLDNTDPDGIDRSLAAIGSLANTLVIVISKSGGTAETRNGMLETQAVFERQKLPFGKHAVAVTMAW